MDSQSVPVFLQTDRRRESDAVQYLPSSAESTKVSNETKAFRGDGIPTGADWVKIAADIRRIDADQ